MRRDAFQAIADPTRRAILWSLRVEASNINTLAEQFDMTRQAVSLHVKYLEECGVITVRKEGRQRLCYLEAKELARINDWLAPFKALWTARFQQLDDVLDNLKNESNPK